MHRDHRNIRMQSRLLRAALRRALWGSLCLIHIAPLISTTSAVVASGQPAAHIVSCCFVWLTFAFFALKFVDVPWLRWHISRSSVLAFVVACGLAHHDVSAGQGAQALFAESPAALSAALLWELTTRTRRAWPRILTTLTNHLRCEIRLWLVACDAVQSALASSWRRTFLCFITIPRGPPAK